MSTTTLEASSSLHGDASGSAPVLTIGQKVEVQRDERRYPSRGTWPAYRGKIGTVVIADNLGEVGIVFGATRRRPDGSLHGDDSPSWFAAHELAVVR